jgi:cytochrome c oxidase cbb3-type subunit 1
MTMYGIITFILWACMYALLPKMTGREPSQLLVGAHFWLAFIGLFAYTISLMAGGTVKGIAWAGGRAFYRHRDRHARLLGVARRGRHR